MNSPLLLFSFILLPTPIPGVVSTGIIFAFNYMCTHFLHHIHLPTPFPNTSPLPLVPDLPPGQDLFCSPVLQFCRRKKEKRENNNNKKNMTF
jgi:hypothetical protein